MRKFNVGDQVCVVSPESMFHGMFGTVAEPGDYVSSVTIDGIGDGFMFLDFELEHVLRADGGTCDCAETDDDFFDGIGCYIDDLEHVADLLERIAALQRITGLVPVEDE